MLIRPIASHGPGRWNAEELVYNIDSQKNDWAVAEFPRTNSLAIERPWEMEKNFFLPIAHFFHFMASLGTWHNRYSTY